MNNLADFYYFAQPFCPKTVLGVHAHLSKCWRGTWSEKGWEPLV